MFGRSRRTAEAKPERDAPALSRGVDRPSPPNHDQVRAADPFAFEIAHRRLAWMLRLSVATNVVLAVVVIVLASSISTLVPLKTIEVALVRLDPVSDEMRRIDPTTHVRIEPLTKGVKGYDIAMEAFARHYVSLVKPIDGVSQDARMTEAQRYSDTKFWEVFAKERLTEFNAAMQSGLTRAVKIETATLMPSRGSSRMYAVDFTQTDARSSSTEITHHRAYLTVTTREQTVRTDERFENPLGIRVLAMSVQNRGN